MSLDQLPSIFSIHGMANPDDSEASDPFAGAAYGYLFPDLADAAASTTLNGGNEKTHKALTGLSRMMGLAVAPPKALDLPPVYTYFGQFLSHDLSAPVMARNGQFRGMGEGIIAAIPEPNDIDAVKRAASGDEVLGTLRNQQSEPLTLNGLYGTGPFGESARIREFYFNKSAVFVLGGLSELPDDIGTVAIDPANLLTENGLMDVPRNKAGGHFPLIVDRRNDDNLILSQLHFALMLFHNRACTVLSETADYRDATQQKLFDGARKLVTWHYQWCVLHDFLPALLHPGSLEAALQGPNLIIRANEVPLEFSTAALRFGHSMVSASYDFNANFGIGGTTKQSASLFDMFMFTSHGRMGDSSGKTRQLPKHWVADWKRLTRKRGPGAFGAEPVDSVLAAPMLTGMGGPANKDHSSIAYRNLMRGYHRRIAFGQDIAKRLNIAPLPDAKLRKMLPLSADDAYDREELITKTPAWFYFLCEAEALEHGKCVGPVASRIIAETIVGLMRHNPHSLLTEGSTWTPAKSPLHTPSDKPVDSIIDMLEFTGLME